MQDGCVLGWPRGRQSFQGFLESANPETICVDKAAAAPPAEDNYEQTNLVAFTRASSLTLTHGQPLALDTGRLLLPLPVWKSGNPLESSRETPAKVQPATMNLLCFIYSTDACRCESGPSGWLADWQATSQLTQ